MEAVKQPSTQRCNVNQEGMHDMIERGLHLMNTWDQGYPDDIWTYILMGNQWKSPQDRNLSIQNLLLS